MAETSGKVTRKQKTTSYRIGPFGLVSGETRSYTEVDADRHGLNDVKLTSATPGLSIFCCKQDEGFIQHGGQDQIIRTEFHTTKREYVEREALPWPGPEDGTITGELPPLLGPPSTPGPKPVTPPNIVNPVQAKSPRRAPKNPMP